MKSIHIDPILFILNLEIIYSVEKKLKISKHEDINV